MDDSHKVGGEAAPHLDTGHGGPGGRVGQVGEGGVIICLSQNNINKLNNISLNIFSSFNIPKAETHFDQYLQHPAVPVTAETKQEKIIEPKANPP